MPTMNDGMAATGMDITGKRIYVAGHCGLVGSALVRRLSCEPCEILTIGHGQLDLRRQKDVEAWMAATQPDIVIVAAAKVGGILANATYPATFLYDNLAIALNVIHSAWNCGVQKLLFLGSSCIYPRETAQPMAERALLTGPLEETNEAYAIAKLAGLKLTETYNRQYGAAFISALPTSLYGPGDNFDLKTSHVIPALIRKIDEAKQANRSSVEIWGDGRPLREFLHADDLADACLFLIRHYALPEPINIGAGREISIRDLAFLIADIVGYEGSFTFDPEKPSGTPRKLLDTSRLDALGWRPGIELRDGIAATYHAWRQGGADLRRGSRQ